MSGDVYSGPAVRRAAWQFLSGKAASALLTFIILLWLVRLLPVKEYGAYVVFIAGTELGIAVAGMGLHWLAARHVPDFRLHASGPELNRLCLRLALWQATALVVVAAAIATMIDFYLHWANLSGYSAVAWLALALLITEGMGRFLSEGLMAPLMLQRQARICLILRQALLLGAIAGLTFSRQAGLIMVLAAEVMASTLAWSVAGIALARHLRGLRTKASEPGWQATGVVEQWRIALRMHAARLITLAYSPQVFLNLVQRALGAEAAALFGFLRTLYEQAGRYLPATLLFSVLRPKLIVSHLHGGMADLARHANLAGKLSLFALLPIIAVVALAGDALVTLLSGNKFAAGGAILFGLLLALVPISQQQIIETVAVATGRPGLCTLGAALGLLSLPLMLILLDMGIGLWAPVLAIISAEIVFNATVLAGLATAGFRPDWAGASKLLASAVLAWLGAYGVMLIGHGATVLVLAILVAALLFIALAWIFEAFTAEERKSLDAMLGRRLFAR